MPIYHSVHAQTIEIPIDTCKNVRNRLNVLADSLNQQGHDTIICIYYKYLNECGIESKHSGPISEKGYLFGKSAHYNLLFKINCSLDQRTLRNINHRLHFKYLSQNRDAVLSYVFKRHLAYERDAKNTSECVIPYWHNTEITVWLNDSKHVIKFPSYLLLDCGEITDSALYNVEMKLYTWVKILEDVIRYHENAGMLEMRY